MNRLERALACAKSWVGLSCRGDDAGLYACVIAPDDTDAARARLADSVSSCASLRGILRSAASI